MANPNPDTTGLRPFQKGQSGNPSGRPKGLTLRGAIRAALASDPDPEVDPPRTLAEKWAREMLAAAIDLEARLNVGRFTEGNQPPIEREVSNDINDLLDDEPDEPDEAPPEEVQGRPDPVQ